MLVGNKNSLWGKGAIIDNSFNINYLNAVYDYVDDISSISSSNSGLNITANGMIMYLLNTNLDTVIQYTLNIPFDTRSRVFVGSFFIGGNNYGMCFNNNYTKFYTSSSGVIKEFDLSTAYLISSATFLQQINLPEVSISTNIKFNNSGSYFYVSDFGNKRVIQYNVSSTYNISTLTFKELFTHNKIFPYGLSFNNDFSKMYISNDEIIDYVYQYNLSTNELVSTASFDSQLEIISGAGRGILWSSDGNYFYHLQTNNIYRYSII